jgi:hypothetical protein
VYLAASAVNTLVRALPAGTAYFIGSVLLTMFTGQLVHHQGSLARAALPYVVDLRWGWQRVERAMERGKVSRAALFARALTWCFEGLPVEPVRLGREQRTGQALDSSTVVRLRANQKRGALLGKGYGPRAQRAVQANLVAALRTVVLIRGIRGGVVRRTRLGATCQEAVAQVFADLPRSSAKRLFSVDAGLATIEQFRAATEQDALVGRLRKNVTLRRAPHPQPPASAGAPRCMGRCGLPEQSDPRDARRKTRRSAARLARSECAAGGICTFGRPPRPSLMGCAWMPRPTSVPC